MAIAKLSIAVSHEDGSRLISVSGELDRSTMLEFIEVCTGHPDDSIIVDLGNVTFMDGGGYSSLDVVREMAEAGRRTVTVRNVRGQPARLMSLFAGLEADQAGTGPKIGEPSVNPYLDAVVDKEVERRYSDLLAEFAQTMVSDIPIRAILDNLVGRIVEVLPIDAAGVTLISSASDPCYVTASDDLALVYERLQGELGESPCIAAYIDGTAVSVPDLRNDGRFPAFARQALADGLGAAFAFPLHHGDRRFGALDLYRRSPVALAARELDVAQTFANVAAAYLVNAEARADLVASTQKANHLALHDSLTGLPNRTLLVERLVNALQRSRRTRTRVAIMYIDLDTFKAVNDTFGHGAGDELLIIVAERLTAVLRPGDTVARLGGDEFAVLCDGITDPAHLEPLAERVNDAFRSSFDLSTGRVEVRASIGIGIGDWTTTSPGRILDDADSAMYTAKRRGGGHAGLDSDGDIRR